MKHSAVNIGMKMIERIDRVRERADQLGFALGKAPIASYDHDTDLISLYPKGDCLPVYSRDACLFTGNLNELERWLDGLDWARAYDCYIGACKQQRREQYEAKQVARLEQIRYNKAKHETFKTLKTNYEEAA